MKNKYLNLKNALISATVAVFTGILLLGVTVALGEAPTYDPPGAGVSPTFSGLTVDGDSNFTGVIQNGTNNDANPFVILDDLGIAGDVAITGDIDISGSIDNSGVNDGGLTVSDIYPGAKYIFNAVAIHGINLIGGVLIDSVGAVKISDQDGVDITGAIINSNGNVKIGDTLDVTGTISDSNSSVTINDSLAITSPNWLYADSIISNDPFGAGMALSGKLNLNSMINFVGNNTGLETTGTWLNINDPLKVTGGTWLQNYVTIGGGPDYDIELDGTEIIATESGQITLRDYNDGKTMTIGKGVLDYSNGEITVNDPLKVTGDLIVDGNVDLSWEMAFADFNENTTGYKTITANCPNNKKILACSIYFSDANAQYARGSGSIINIIGLLFGIQGCVGTYYQTANVAVPGIVTGTCI